MSILKTDAAVSSKMVPLYKAFVVTSQRTIILTRYKSQYRQENALTRELDISAAVQYTYS
jgi:hypothetical protein